VAYDSITISLSLYLCIALRTGNLTYDINQQVVASFFITLAISLIAFIKLGLYRAILRYSPQEALVAISLGASISATALASSSFFFTAGIPRSSPIIFFLSAVILLGAPRLLIRNIVNFNRRHNEGEPVIVYGAGHSGHQLALSLESNPQYKVVAFVDDNNKLNRSKLRNLTIHRSKKLEELAEQHNVKTILIAISALSRNQRKIMIQRLEKASLTPLTIPPVSDIVSGKARIEDVKPVAIEDLLGREPVPAHPGLLHACISGKNVMITGAGGSIGSELCRQIVHQNPKRIILFELSEFSLYRIEQELNSEIQKNNQIIEVIPLLGTIQHRQRLTTIMRSFEVHTVYHAAAYKHVPLVEHNLIEGVRNNIFGTWFCAEAAIDAQVESFVLISTDKAVRPTSIMGASKRVAELVLQGLSKRQNTTRFTMVRFGNVLGSSGSVVPLFKKQIEQGGPITVTHPDIIRYFMAIPEAAELVIQAGSMGQDGDVFVLDMGDPVNITDLAIRMIHLSGLEVKNEEHPNGDIEIRYSGLRPGEKLYEELLIGDSVSGTEHQRIMRAEEKSLTWPETKQLLQRLDESCHKFQCDQVKNLLLEAPTDYNSNERIEDWAWNQSKTLSGLRLVDSNS